MASLWSEEAKLSRWLEIEILACEAMASRRIIPRQDARTIRRRAKFNLRQVQKNEARTKHDVLAFLEEVASHVGPAGRWIHQGLTSSDILDTTLAWQLRDAADLLIEGVRKVRQAAALRARRHRGLLHGRREHVERRRDLQAPDVARQRDELVRPLGLRGLVDLRHRGEHGAAKRKAGVAVVSQRAPTWIADLLGHCLAAEDVHEAIDGVIDGLGGPVDDRMRFLLAVADHFQAGGDKMTALHYLNTGAEWAADGRPETVTELAQRLEIGRAHV